jgi:O-antigen/teichoic acid export membrane protein
VRRHLGGFGRPDARLARRMLGFGLKAHLARVMTLGNYRLDQWILGAMAGPRHLGYYSVAVSWAEALFFLPTTLALVQRPDLVRSSGDDAGRRAAMVFRAAVVITCVLAVAMILLAPFLCVTIFGPEFDPSIGQLRLLALGAFGVVALKLFGNALTAQGRPLLEMRAVALAFALIVGLDVLLIPSLEGTGAAIGSLVGYSAGGLFILVIAKRHLGLSAADMVPRPRDAIALVRSLRDAIIRRGRVTPTS